MVGEGAADSRLVAELPGGCVAGDGAAERLHGGILLTLGTKHGGASLGDRRRPRPAVPERGDLVDTPEEGAGAGGVPDACAHGRGGDVVVDGTDRALGFPVQQRFGTSDDGEGLSRVLGRS